MKIHCDVENQSFLIQWPQFWTVKQGQNYAFGKTITVEAVVAHYCAPVMRTKMLQMLQILLTFYKSLRLKVMSIISILYI